MTNSILSSYTLSHFFDHLFGDLNRHTEAKIFSDGSDNVVYVKDFQNTPARDEDRQIKHQFSFFKGRRKEHLNEKNNNDESLQE